MKKVVLLIFLLAGTACTQQQALPPPASATPPPQILTIGVSGSATAVTDLITATYAPQYPNVILQFVTANSDVLLNDLQNGQLNAIFSHTVPENSTFWTNPIALDGVVAIVHPTNSVTSLTRGELQAIFNGRLTNWSALGGQDVPITLISRPWDADSYQLFTERVMSGQRININAQLQPTDSALHQAVVTTEGAIGFSMMGNSQNANLFLLAIDGHLPTVIETAVQSYPLTVPLYFIHANEAEPTGELRALLAWIQSMDGQAVLGERYGRIR